MRRTGEGREEEKIKVTALYLLENEGFHSSKDEGRITKRKHKDTALTQSRADPTTTEETSYTATPFT